MATAACYDSFLANALGGIAAGTAPNIDFLSDTIKATLHTSTYAPSKTAHDFVDDLTNEVAATGGYATGGVTLATKTLGITSSVIKLDADDAVWASATITNRHVVVSDRTPGTAATQPLISYVNNTTDAVSTGGEHRVAWHANGIVSITVGAEA